MLGISTVTLGYIGWTITLEAIKDTKQNILNWSISIAFFATLVSLFWKVYADWKTIITEEEIIRPGLLGMRVIRWSEVTHITRVGFGIHIHATFKKIVITPYAYKEPFLIICQIYEQAEKRRIQ